jgi:hypothetical protein
MSRLPHLSSPRREHRRDGAVSAQGSDGPHAHTRSLCVPRAVAHALAGEVLTSAAARRRGGVLKSALLAGLDRRSLTGAYGAG